MADCEMELMHSSRIKSRILSVWSRAVTLTENLENRNSAWFKSQFNFFAIQKIAIAIQKTFYAQHNTYTYNTQVLFGLWVTVKFKWDTYI